MRVAVTGASGNVGTAVLRALDPDSRIDEIVALCRHPPTDPLTKKATWITADVTTHDLTPVFRGCDAVVHLAWVIQPSRNRQLMHRINVDGSARVFRAAAEAGVPALVHASSVGVYSPGPKDRPVEESWRRDGIGTSYYSEHKAAAEKLLDDLEREHPAMRVVRLRPGLIFQRGASTEIARYFLGPFVPRRLLRRSFIPIVPLPEWLRFQAVHSDDVAAAYVAAVTSDASGAFNIAADPVLDGKTLGEFLGARPVSVPISMLRRGADLTYRLRLQPTDAGWVDMAGQSPVLDTSRARSVLGWAPRFSSTDALGDLLDGFAHGAAGPTPVLAARR